jgi:cell wall-associated NlpC family hydrolase
MRPLRVVAGLTAASLIASAGVTYMLMMTSLGQTSDQASAGGGASCVATVNAPTSARLDQDQLTNAYTIVRVGVFQGIPRRGLVVAIATALQESYLRNLHYGDRDSVGLFQQRPSSGWGTVAELTDPPTSAGKFYAALVKVPNWQALPITVAAQAVQRSAFPNAYAKWEALATTLVDQMVSGNAATVSQTVTVDTIGCSLVVGDPIASNSSGGMLQIALAQRGKPYVWGATGPDSFDCSGLVVYAWRRSGHSLRVRTSEEMYRVSDRVAAGAEQPGDLLFMHFASAGPGHVMIVVQKGVAVEAPQTGDVVKLISYDSNALVIGRLNAQAFTDGTVPG